jgi:hypothetical protein
VCGAAAGDGDDVGVAGVKRFGCRYCEYQSERADHVTIHERSHTGEKPYGCRFCDYRAAEASKIPSRCTPHRECVGGSCLDFGRPPLPHRPPSRRPTVPPPSGLPSCPKSQTSQKSSPLRVVTVWDVRMLIRPPQFRKPPQTVSSWVQLYG